LTQLTDYNFDVASSAHALETKKKFNKKYIYINATTVIALLLYKYSFHVNRQLSTGDKRRKNTSGIVFYPACKNSYLNIRLYTRAAKLYKLQTGDTALQIAIYIHFYHRGVFYNMANSVSYTYNY